MAIEYEINEQQSSAILVLKQRLAKFETKEGRIHGLSYKPIPNDVVISSSPKAGTTWVQQICHQIRCASTTPEICMDFDEISRVVPWIELAKDLNQDLCADQLPTNDFKNLPRLFKTHCWYNHCPHFPKSIVVVRDPKDVLLSFYNFFEGWFFEPGSIDLETFADEFWLARGIPDDTMMQNASYFVHLTSWYTHRLDSESSKVLFVFYENLVESFEDQIRRIAKFLSNEHYDFNTDETIRHTIYHSSFNFMKANEHQFDEKLTKLARNEACGLPKDAGMRKSKIGKQECVGTALISEELHLKIQNKWNEIVFPVTGCKSYNEFRMKLGEERNA